MEKKDDQDEKKKFLHFQTIKQSYQLGDYLKIQVKIFSKVKKSQSKIKRKPEEKHAKQ